MNCINTRAADEVLELQFEFLQEQRDQRERELLEQREEAIQQMLERCKTCLYADTDGDEPICLALGTTLIHMTPEECEDCYERGDLADKAAEEEEVSQ